MKRITNYINENANFLVKKHVKTDSEIITIKSEKDLKPGCYWACDAMKCAYGKLTYPDMFTHDDDNTCYYNQEFAVYGDSVMSGTLMSKNNPENKWRTITEEELSILKDIEEYIKSVKNIDPGNIGVIRNGKFYPHYK